jgi:hypothetical protein
MQGDEDEARYERMGIPGEDLVYADGRVSDADKWEPLEYLDSTNRMASFDTSGGIVIDGDPNARRIFTWLDRQMEYSQRYGELSIRDVDPRHQLSMYLGTFYHAIMYRYFACCFITASIIRSYANAYFMSGVPRSKQRLVAKNLVAALKARVCSVISSNDKIMFFIISASVLPRESFVRRLYVIAKRLEEAAPANIKRYMTENYPEYRMINREHPFIYEPTYDKALVRNAGLRTLYAPRVDQGPNFEITRSWRYPGAVESTL